MTDVLREHIANERRRLREVREALSRSVEDLDEKSDQYPPFYLAISAYLEASMERLHAQDVKMGDMIREKAGDKDRERVDKALSELDERLAGNQEHLIKFLSARDALADKGGEALPGFEKVARDYTRYIVANMGHHGATTELAQELFSQDDWVFMAGVTDEDMAREQALHDQVEKALPSGTYLGG